MELVATTKALPQKSNWFREAKALFLKDLQAEARTKVAISAIGVFSFASLLLIGIATQVLREQLSVPLGNVPSHTFTYAELQAVLVPSWDDSAKMGLLWVLLCFAAFSGLSHSFVHEEEAGTVTALRLNMCPGAVYAGKYAFNLSVISAVTLVVTPAYIGVTSMNTGSFLIFLSVMACGCIGLSGAATIVAALAAKARGTGALFGAIGLPLLVVFLLMLLNAARNVYVKTDAIDVIKNVGGLLSFGILLIAVSAITFPFVWEE